jgi:hypothetical protein
MIATPSYSIPKGVNSGVFGIVTGKFCKEVEYCIAVAKSKGYVLPTDYQLRMLSYYINELKSNSIWSAFDLFYLFSYNSLLSNNNVKGTAVGNMLNDFNIGNFTKINLIEPDKYELQREDFSSPAGAWNPYYSKIGWDNSTNVSSGGKYFNTLWNPALALKYSQNDAAITGFVENYNDRAACKIGGVQPSSGARGHIQLQANGTWTGSINSTANQNYSTGNASNIGYHHVQRTASNLTTWYHNNSSVGTSTAASSTPPTDNFLILYNGNGGFSTVALMPVGLFRVGASLTEKQRKTDYELYINFRTQLGL